MSESFNSQNMHRAYLYGPNGERYFVGVTSHRSGLSLALSFVGDPVREHIPGWDGSAVKRSDRVEFPGGWVLKHG